MKKIILTLISLIAVSAYSAYADDTLLVPVEMPSSEIQSGIKQISDTLIVCPKCEECYPKTPRFQMSEITDILGECANWVTQDYICRNKNERFIIETNVCHSIVWCKKVIVESAKTCPKTGEQSPRHLLGECYICGYYFGLCDSTPLPIRLFPNKNYIRHVDTIKTDIENK